MLYPASWHFFYRPLTASRPLSTLRAFTMASVLDAARKTVSENLGGVAHGLAPSNEQFSEQDVPDLSGKVAVMTGATQGIGFATAHTLLAHNIAQLHMLSMSEEVAGEALDNVRSGLGEEYSKRIQWHRVDMSDLKDVQAVAQKIAKSVDRLDILVNNAARGIMTYQVAEKTGLDRHMSVNHLGPCVLTSTLLPLMKQTAAKGQTVRISNQASNAHQGAPPDVKFASKDELNQDLGANAQYGRSKLAAILYSRYLAAHLTLDHPMILANATHPGIVNTEMSTKDIHEPFPIAGYVMSTLMKPLKKDQWEGAASTLYAATKTEKSGEYICPPATPEQGSAMSQDKELGEQLMTLTREVLCEQLGVEKWDNY